MTRARLSRRRLLLAGAGTVTTAAALRFEPAAAGTTTTKVFTGEFLGTPDLPDWHYLPFHVPSGVRRISVTYSYTPTPTSLGTTLNVVDIGIFGPAGVGLGDARGFRGWSGGARRSFSLSRSAATPGYLAGRIDPGRWRIALGPYQITPTGTPYRVEVTLHHGPAGRRFRPEPAPLAVAGRGAGWYRGDLHIHTVHSDGSSTQEQVLADARAAGLDFIGSSEHNTSSAQLTWGRYVPGDFLVIPGEEVTTRAGHWVAAGLPAGTWIDWRYRPADGQLGRFTDQVRGVGGLSIAAHPFQAGTGIGWQFGTSFTEVDAIEVWNGPWGADDQVAVQRWHQLLLGGGPFKPAVGNSDSHNHQQQVGRAQTVVRAESLSVADVLAGYRGGHSWLTESSAVDLDFTATLGDVSGECGDRVPSGAGEVVDVLLDVRGVPGCLAQVIGPAGVLAGAVADADGRVVVATTAPGGSGFVRAEVRRPTASVSDPTAVSVAPMVAMTNPIFLSPAPAPESASGV